MASDNLPDFPSPQFQESNARERPTFYFGLPRLMDLPGRTNSQPTCLQSLHIASPFSPEPKQQGHSSQSFQARVMPPLQGLPSTRRPQR